MEGFNTVNKTEDGSKRIFHNSKYIVLKGFLTPMFIIFLMIGNGNLEDFVNGLRAVITGKSPNIGLILGAGAGLLVIMIFFAIRSWYVWKNTFIAVYDSEIYYQRKGFFKVSRKRTNIANITNINLKANILERLFQVKCVGIDINSVETASDEDYKIILSNKNAVDFKAMLDRKVIEQKEGVQPKPEKSRYKDYTDEGREILSQKKFTTGESIRHIVFDNIVSWIVIIAVFVILGVFLSSKGGSGRSSIFLFLGVVMSVLLSMVKSIDAAMGFSVSRSSEHIHISHGFFSKNEYVIPVENIVGINVEQTLVSVICGYRYIKLRTVGLEQKPGSDGLCLMMKKDEVEDLVSQILPEFPVYSSAKMRPVGVFIYNLIYMSVILVPLGAALHYAMGYFWIRYIPVAVPLLIVLIAAYKYLTLGFKEVEGDYIVRDGLVPSYRLIKRDRVDSVKLSENPLYRAFGLSSLELQMKGAKGRVSVRGLVSKTEDFDSLFEFYRRGEQE